MLKQLFTQEINDLGSLVLCIPEGSLAGQAGNTEKTQKLYENPLLLFLLKQLFENL